MGVLGTSKYEEDALKAVSYSIERSDSKYSHSTSNSAYESFIENDKEFQDSLKSFKHQLTSLDQDGTSENGDMSPDLKYEIAWKSFEESTTELPVYLDKPSQLLHDNDKKQAVSAAGRTKPAQAVRVTQEKLVPIRASELEFDDPSDPENPLGWPKWKKWAVTLTMAQACMCISLGTSLYVEAVPQLEMEFGCSRTLGIAGLTFYLIGLSLGPVIASPLSEMYGRRWIYIIAFPVSMIFTMGVGLSQNMGSVLILRFLSGFSASPPMTIASGTISDMWAGNPDEMAFAMCSFGLAPFLGPILGPIIGGFVVENKDWRWTMWVCLMFFGSVLPFILACPETYKIAILKSRARKRGIKLVKESFSVKEFARIYLVRPVEMLFVEPIVGLTSVYIAFVFAVLFSFFEAYPIVFQHIYGMNTGVSGLPFLGAGFGLTASVTSFLILYKLKTAKKSKSEPNLDEHGKEIEEPPERALATVKVGSLLIPIGLFWMAWSAKKSVHWIVPSLSGIPFGFGLFWIYFGVILYYSLCFPPEYVASAVAGNNLIRYLLAGVFPLFTVQMYEKLHVDWATSLLGFISLTMIPIPFMFFKFGSKLRQRSKYSYSALLKQGELKAQASVTTNGSDRNPSWSTEVAEKV